MRRTLGECRWLYNHLLEERKRAWEEHSESLSYYSQNITIPPLKEERPSLKEVYSQVLQDVAVRLDLAFKAFFRRVKAGEKEVGFPRFRGAGRYDSFCYPGSGHKVDGDRVALSKIGRIKAVIHRPLAGTVKTCCVRRTSTGKWFATFSCEVEDAPLPARDNAVGIDVGLSSFATLSDGSAIPNPRFFRRDEKALAQVQRRKEKRRKGTPAWRKAKRAVARVHERIANRRSDFAHQHSRRIVNEHQVIAVEDLSINQMIHNHCLAKSISDAAWGQFAQYLQYKAECAGRSYVAVSPAYTSQDCSKCHHRQKLTLADRVYRCPCCDLELDRDHNASLNILAVGLHSIGERP